MSVQVLLSCMYQTNNNLIEESNLSSVNTLLINQTDVKKQEKIIIDSKHTIINTPTKGLSISRNLAIENANKTICLISDHDEIFIDDLEATIEKGFNSLSDADVIIWKNPDKNFGNKTRILKKFELLRCRSSEISFKLNSIKRKIYFDTLLGAGTPNGSGEENKFLLDCYKKGLKIYYIPQQIAIVKHTKKSTWFFGFTKEYFYNRGKSTRYIFGFFFSSLYGVYFLVVKYKKYCEQISFFSATKNLFLGILKNDLKKQKQN